MRVSESLVIVDTARTQKEGICPVKHLHYLIVDLAACGQQRQCFWLHAVQIRALRSPCLGTLGQLQGLFRGVHAIVNLSPDVVGCTKQMADLGRLRFTDDLKRVV